MNYIVIYNKNFQSLKVSIRQPCFHICVIIVAENTLEFKAKVKLFLNFYCNDSIINIVTHTICDYVN